MDAEEIPEARFFIIIIINGFSMSSPMFFNSVFLYIIYMFLLYNIFWIPFGPLGLLGVAPAASSAER